MVSRNIADPSIYKWSKESCHYKKSSLNCFTYIYHGLIAHWRHVHLSTEIVVYIDLRFTFRENESNERLWSFITTHNYETVRMSKKISQYLDFVLKII
jgi:hypothetical protein